MDLNYFSFEFDDHGMGIFTLAEPIHSSSPSKADSTLHSDSRGELQLGVEKIIICQWEIYVT